MIDDVREKGLQAKQESDIEATKTIGDHQQAGSRLWLGLKDPRIVRVSRSFGGKDRHSKVRTVRGLRDRRVRLSTSTAIQLYDLQERLGLNQPSKVVDWLLNASQHEIEKLPPLQWPPGINFDHMPQEVEATDIRRIDQESSGDGSGHGHQGGTTNNIAMYTSYYNLDAMANVDTSNFGGNHCHEQEEDTEHGYRSEINLSLMPNSQLMLCPSGIVSTTFHPYASSSSGYDMKYLNHYPTLATSLHNSFSIPFQSGDSTAPFPTENLPPFTKLPRK